MVILQCPLSIRGHNNNNPNDLQVEMKPKSGAECGLAVNLYAM